MVRLEIYLNDMDRDPLASIVCNMPPRTGERITLLSKNAANQAGTYRVLGVEHILDDAEIESVQHICLIVMRETYD
jgi:hypothetical protein